MTTPTTHSTHKPIVTWFEIAVSDLAKATKLYEATIDTTLKAETFLGVPHSLFQGPDGPIGALIDDPKRSVKGGHSTVIYLLVDNVARALARAVEAGAKVVQPETSLGPQGSFALIEDFDKNVVGIHAR